MSKGSVGQVIFNKETEKTYCMHNTPDPKVMNPVEMKGGETVNTKDGTVHYFLTCPKCYRTIDAQKGFK